MDHSAKNIIKNNPSYYFIRSSYYIMSNLPSSELIYIIMFSLKYIGLIVNSRIIEMTLNKNTISLNKYLSNFLIFGKNFSPVNHNYQFITISSAIFLFFYIIYIIFCCFYLKIKYKNIQSLIQEKMAKSNENVEIILFKIISYFNFALVFFHQYILEYFYFGIYGFIYYKIGIFSKNGTFSNKYVETLHDDLYYYFLDNNHILIFIANLFVIINISFLFYYFLLYNTTKGLFLIHGIYCGNMKYLTMKFIFLSFHPFFAIINFYSEKSKIIIGLIMNCIIIIFSLINFWSCLHQFGYYSNIVSNLSLFIEFFVFFTSILELILYFIGWKKSMTFFIVKIIIELINSYFLMILFLYLKDNHNLNVFAKNLFSKNFSKVSKGGLYYYMRVYLQYQKDKKKNYLKLFKIIETHIKYCKKIDCPGHILIPIEYLKSSFSSNELKIKEYYNENNIILKDEEKKESLSDIDENDEEDILINNNLNNIFMNNKNSNNKENNKKNNKYNLYESIFDGQKRLSDKQFQIILEQEIINQIEFLYKSKKNYLLEDFIFIHLQYLYAMKKNYSLTLYYIGKYENCGIKWSFMGQYYLYLYKKVILSIFFHKSNINNVDKNANKYRKDNHLMKEIINYFIFSSILKNLIIESCSKLKLLFTFRKDLHIPIFIKSYNRTKTEKFFEIGQDLKNSIDKILYFLRHILTELNQKTISAELSYIISNFFIFIENMIPNDLRKIINPDYDINLIANKIESGYKFLNLVHPLILSLTRNNKFNICYFSSVISNRLGYFQFELKNKDFHEKLFPGVLFIKQHELLMKQFLFFDINSHFKKDTFLKTKEGYMVGVKLTAKKFPTFYDYFFIIIGIDFNDELFFSEINKNFNRYSFMLDTNLDFISQTKNFYQDFQFNIYMFKEMKMNFVEFFCIDKNFLIDKLKKNNINILKNNKVNNIYNLKKEDDAFALFKSINYEKAYDLRDISKLESMKNEHLIIQDKISKDKIIKMIPEFSKLIEEYGLDFEWYQHLENLSERLLIKEFKKEEEDNSTQYSKNIVSLDLNSNNKDALLTNNSYIKLNNKNNNIDNSILKNINRKNIINNNENVDNQSNSSLSLLSKNNRTNKNEKNNRKRLERNNTKIQSLKIIFDRNFDVIYNLKKIGTIYYYIVNLYEKTIYRNDEIYSLIYQSNHKLSLIQIKKNGEESFKIIDKNDEETKFIKAKTLLTNQKNNKKNFPELHLGDTKSNTIEEQNSIIEVEDKQIEKVKTWASDNNNIDLKKHIIKESERIFNNEDFLIVNNKNDKISLNSEGNNNKNNIIKRKNIERKTKKIGTRRKSIDINNIKNKEEEKIIFIKKDKLEEYIKKSNYFNRYFIAILFLLFLVIIIIIAIKLALARNNFSITSYLTNGIIYLEEIKSDIYIGCIIALSQCFRIKSKDLPLGLAIFPLQLSIKSSDLKAHLNLFETQLKLTKNIDLLINIMDYLYKNITIYNLNPDWTRKTEQSYLIKEINYFSYLLNGQSFQYEIKCDFENNFYLIFFNTSEQIYNLNNKEETSFYQRFIYYIALNIIYTFKPLFRDIIEEIIKVQIKIMNNYLTRITIINSILIFILLLCEIIIALKNMIDIYFIKYIFLYLYEYEQNQLQFEYEINYLEITAKEFNLNNLIQLENIKHYNYDYLNYQDLYNSNEILLNDLNMNVENKNIGKKSIIDKMINKYQKINNELEKNSMNSSLFNNSNNSMIHLINQNNSKDEIIKLKDDNKKYNNINIEQVNKNKKILNNEINYNIRLDEEDKILNNNEETLELLKTNNKIIPSKIIAFIYLSLILSFIFILIVVLNMIDINRKRNIWEYGVNLAMNYLDKIPSIIEIGVSTILTIILGVKNNVKYYKKEEYPKLQEEFMTYFTRLKNYDNSELISSNIKDSLFANELYNNYRIKKNIKFAEDDDFFKDYFKSSKYWDKKLNEDNNYCINAGLKSVLFFNKWITTLDIFFQYLEAIGLTCISENEKINDSGLDLEIDFILHELSFLYIDFEETENTNITLAREKFFQNENFIRMLKDMNVPFTFAIGTLFSSVNEDITQLNKMITHYELVFISITSIICSIFSCFLIIMLLYNEKMKKILVFIGKILKKE